MAINQKITYDEYLPKVIGPDFMSVLGIDQPYVYDDSIDASITSVFGAAAFRFGHSQINGDLMISKSDKRPISEIFFRPETTFGGADGVMKNIMLNQAKQPAQRTDRFFSPQVLDHLFKDVDAPGESFDLPALAVHRCRDHGLPGYLEYVDYISKRLAENGGTNAFKVSELSLPACILEGIYESVRDIDLFVGAMYETAVPGGLVGPTFAYLIGEQFHRLKFGDRFWYETTNSNIGFTPDQLKEIQDKTGLAFLMCKNNDKLKRIHPRPMETLRTQDKKACSSYADIDFSHWAE
ncbi:peroxidase-like protein [Plakobranchus ocellatus]|uniref:Peroxidase-like protein n=1 Tax=Plakobranchus ocellatus TaxID=259542 RepID=A0AAV3YG85_9GAST|nr:peroxidase-like protein [Plakobranchus ocellatus]